MDKIYRGIVVVHGVGEHRQGTYVSGFVDQLVKYVQSIDGLSGNVELTARNRSDRGDTSWATIHIDNPSGPDEEWHIREAWWTRTFEPSNPGRIYLWAILAGLALLWAAVVQQLARGLLAFFSPGRLALWPSERAGRPFDLEHHVPLPPAQQGVWRQPPAGWAKSIADAVVWLLLTGLFLIVGAIGILLIGIVYLVLVLPLSFVLPSLANWIVRAAMKLIVFTLGDQEAMTTRKVAIAAAANEVNNGLWYMLSRQGLASRGRDDQGFGGFETVTVVAHSGGCVVSLAALRSHEFKRFRSEPLTGKYHRPARVNWITAGSGLNLAWNVRVDESSDQALWAKPLEAINWLNLYSRYDPVPQGPPPVEMVDAVAGLDSERHPGAPGRAPFVGVRIVNADSPWVDHGGYWGNHEEVMSRVVHLITDGQLATNALTPERTEVGPKNLPGAREAILSATGLRADARRTRVTRKMLALVFGLAAFAVVLGFWADDAGRWALGTDTFLGIDPWAPGGHKLENVVTKKLASFKIEEYRDRLVGAAVIGFVVLIVADYARLFRWLWGFARSRDDRRARALWFIGGGIILLSTLAILDLLLIRWPTGALT